MEGHHVPPGGHPGDPPGHRNDVHQFSRNSAIMPYPQSGAAPMAPPGLGGMAPASASGRGYPMYYGAGFAGFGSSPPMSSHYSAFLDHHRAFAMTDGPTQGFNSTGPEPLPYRGDRPVSIQNAPPGPYGSQYPGFGGNGPSSSSGSSFTPSLYDSGHDFYNGPASTGRQGSPSPNGRRPPSFESRGHPDFSAYGPLGSYDSRPPNNATPQGPIDGPAPILMSPFRSIGSPGIGRASASDGDDIPAGFRGHGGSTLDSKQCEDNEKVALTRSGPTPHSSLKCQQVPEDPTRLSLNLQSQEFHRGETCAQQLASAVRQGLTFKEYQEIHGKAIDEPELKGNKILPLNLAGNRGTGTSESLEEESGSRAAIPFQSYEPGASGQMAGRGVGRDPEDARGQLGSLVVGQKGHGTAARIQTLPHLHNAPANAQNSSRASLHNSNAQGSNIEGNPLETLRLAGGGPKSNPNTPTRRRPNQAQRRQSRRQSELLVAPAPAAAVVPQTPQRGYPRDGNGLRQPPGPPLKTQHDQTDYKPSHPQHVTNQRHLQQLRAYDQTLVPVQQAYFGNAGAGDQRPTPQPNQVDGGDSYQPITLAQVGPRQPQQQQRSLGRFPMGLEEIVRIQSDYLAEVASVEVAKAAVDPQEVAEKEAFRFELEATCRDVISRHEAGLPGGDAFNPGTIRLECFGSLSSGFATKSSDMDLILLSPLSRPPLGSSDSPIPRLLEKRLLDLGLGARFLTKTRVPIMKLCEKPPAELLDRLRKARERWEAGEDNSTTTSEKDNDSTFALSLSQDIGRIQQMSLNDNEDSVTPASHNSPDLQEAKEANSPTHRLQQLKQNPKEALWAYNSRARKLLRALGGRDITLRHENLQSSDLELLTATAEAFIDGILDENIRKAVRASLPKNVVASLYGVWLLAEGEQEIMRWETRKIHELTGEKEAQGNKLIQEWRQLRVREGVMPAQYNEALRKILEQLQQLPSLRLLSLTQRQDEPAEMYSVRATAILEELGGIDCDPGMWEDQLSPPQRALLELVIRQYIEGVHDLPLRKEVRRTCSRRNVSLADVTSIHHAELSIQKYKPSISRGLYSSEEQEILKEHAQLVRLYGLKSDREDVRAVLEKMKGIPDPSPPSKQRDFVDALEFPKAGVGIQCDINFSNLLALYNTALLRCYSYSDPRVCPMVIFVKAWAKKRKINSPYHGTLSSYGYVLLVLHYLLNVASPPVLVNLQHAWEFSEREFHLDGGLCEGYDVKFWCDEEEIKRLASLGQFTQNRQPLGVLLRGFFEYYSHQGPHVIKNGFVWNLNTISIRTQGGLLSKQVKGWTEAKTVSISGKEVRQRYLLAIEDPFETDHNVGRTVTYHGILAIRDEFRRAWRIISSVGRDHRLQDGLFDEVVEVKVRREKASPKDTGSQKTSAGAQDRE
jgi:terminal uridylyltransferase